MSTPTFELDRPSAASIAMLDVNSPMMQAPVRRSLWSCLRRRRAHWGLSIHRGSVSSEPKNNWIEARLSGPTLKDFFASEYVCFLP
jgi:hypothetical protein